MFDDLRRYGVQCKECSKRGAKRVRGLCTSVTVLSCRNYIFNKQNGLVIKPFVNAHTNRRTDKVFPSEMVKYVCKGS